MNADLSSFPDAILPAGSTGSGRVAVDRREIIVVDDGLRLMVDAMCRE